MRTGINRLAESIERFCAAHVLEEKWLLAPSLRIGLQWLDAVARSGRPVLNARVKTIASLALEIGAPEMERRHLSMLRGVQEDLLVYGLLARLRDKGGYLTRLDVSPGMVRTASATLRDLRLCGLAAAEISPRCFEVASKGREIISLLSAYEEELSSRGLVDLAGVLRLAVQRLAAGGSALPPGVMVAVAADMLEEMPVLQRVLWLAIPEDRRLVLEVDLPGEDRNGGASDSALLAWTSRPADAPPPTGDGSVSLFRAIGEVNEAREVMRRCVDAGIPLDEVEILHSDASTYVPLLYEVCSLLAPEPGEAVPATFLEGIPVRYSRPARALAAWLAWIGEDFPQAVLVRMVQDGLVDLGSAVDAWGFSRLGAALRALPIGKGRERYLASIDAELDSLAWRKEHLAREENGEEEGAAYLERRMEMLRSLHEMSCELLGSIPATAQEGRGLLRAAEGFLLARARGTNELDEYGRLRLLDGIRELLSCITEEDERHLDARGWLVELARSARVEGKGPRPGCVYVAPLAGGGHSGRPHTFVVGLDDGRFPGAGLQDPLLLDAERAVMSEGLPTAAGRLAASLEDFSRLAARMRGEVTLSYCCRSLGDDREMFPSPVLLAAYRIVTGDREGVQDDLLAWLREPISFAPQESRRCLDPGEWWLHRLCGDPAVADPESTVARSFPHLGRGLAARRARESDLFTAYDGNVPEAGEDLDPTRPGGPVLSASRLETLGRCPMEYFFTYVLGIKPPEEYLLDPSRWLEPTEKGSLLHAVFHRFHLRLHAEERRPTLQRDWRMLQEILEGEMAAWTHRRPPPNREAYEREADDLRRAARIFLQEEEEHCRGRRPLYFEVAIGLKADAEGNPIDSLEPVELVLPHGKTIRTRGYIDRIDELGEPGSKRFSVCDYKTGSSFAYKQDDPFRQGRCVQNLLYTVQAGSRLAQCHPGAAVETFQYFFPSTREHGERIEWNAGTLAGGMGILEKLCEMLTLGCFPFTDDAGDVSLSDYRAAFGDIEAAVVAMRTKLSNPDNTSLSPFRVLRGYAEEEHG